MRGRLRGSLIVTVGMLAGILPVASDASVLCKNRRGTLLVRETCRSREQALTPQAIDQLGIRGPAGAAGPPGAPGGGLHVVDSLGSDVGLVTSLNSYYGQYARVVREMVLPDKTTPEFVLFSVTPTGLRTSSYACGNYYGTYYRTPDCSGQRFDSCEYGSCTSASGAFLYTSLLAGDDGVACYTRGGPEFERGDFYRESRFSSPSAAGVTEGCTADEGTIIGPIGPCFQGSTYFCGQCCRLEHAVGVAPVHSVDLSTVGTPPFRLAR